MQLMRKRVRHCRGLMKHSTIAWLLLLTVLPATVTAQRSAVRGAVGVATGDADGGMCLAIEDAELSVGAQLMLLDVSQRGRPVAARVSARRTAPCGRSIVPNDDSLYELTVSPHDTVQVGAIYFAVARFSPDVAVSGAEARLDIDGDGMPEVLRSCTSSEGLHLTSWSADGLAGERLWHRYVYLGYDVEPSCTDMEVAPR